MRTTVRLDDDLLRRAMERAARTCPMLTALIEDGLRMVLARPEKGHAKVPTLPASGSGGLQPGVDRGDSAALLDLLERGRGPPQ